MFEGKLSKGSHTTFAYKQDEIFIHESVHGELVDEIIHRFNRPDPPDPAYLEEVRKFLEDYLEWTAGIGHFADKAKVLLAELLPKVMTVGDVECGWKGRFIFASDEHEDDPNEYMKMERQGLDPNQLLENTSGCVDTNTGRMLYFSNSNPVISVEAADD